MQLMVRPTRDTRGDELLLDDELLDELDPPPRVGALRRAEVTPYRTAGVTTNQRTNDTLHARSYHNAESPDLIGLSRPVVAQASSHGC